MLVYGEARKVAVEFHDAAGGEPAGPVRGEDGPILALRRALYVAPQLRSVLGYPPLDHAKDPCAFSGAAFAVALS